MCYVESLPLDQIGLNVLAVCLVKHLFKQCKLPTFKFPLNLEQDFGGTSGAFEGNVKQLHDWLSTMEVSRVAIGDADDMDRASQRQTVSLSF